MILDTGCQILDKRIEFIIKNPVSSIYHRRDYQFVYHNGQLCSFFFSCFEYFLPTNIYKSISKLNKSDHKYQANIVIFLTLYLNDQLNLPQDLNDSKALVEFTEEGDGLASVVRFQGNSGGLRQCASRGLLYLQDDFIKGMNIIVVQDYLPWRPDLWLVRFRLLLFFRDLGRQFA